MVVLHFFNKSAIKLIRGHVSHVVKRSCNDLTMAKRLAAFDFDHTILDDNSDTVVIDLIKEDLIPSSVKQLYTSDNWTNYMQSIFELLYQYNIDEYTIKKTVKEIAPVQGMGNLLRELKSNLNFDIIIISDSNSCFIKTWLKAHKLSDVICKIFTNPAEFKNGLLKIEMYHLQDSCKLSTKNLCKGQILEDFIKDQIDSGVIYDQVVYVGDGTNDFCPIVRMRTDDIACVRENYRCANMIKHVSEGKPVSRTGLFYDIKPSVCLWNTGHDILDAIQSKLR